MRRRLFWLLAFAVSGVVGTAGMAPALARGGATGVVAAGPRSFAHAPFARPQFRGGFPRAVVAGRGNQGFNLQNDLLRRGAGLGAIVAWPYLWSLDPAPEQISLAGDDPPAAPQIIVVSGSPGGAPTPAALTVPPDFSYVAGCHAIPGGYHCDPPSH
jgi:hypothetical protein